MLIADDHAVVREALADLLGTAGDTAVVATCADGTGVVATAERTPTRRTGAEAVDHLLEDDPPDDLPDRIRAVASGGTAWSETAAAALA